jgi:hypothetical protein
MKFWDTETCGLHGPIVLIQYADGIAGEMKLSISLTRSFMTRKGISGSTSLSIGSI